MGWVRLNSPQLGSAKYDADHQVLLIRNRRAIARYYPISPHQVESLLDTPDPVFYFEYFIQPSLVSSRRRARTRLYNLTKLAAASLLIYLSVITPAAS